MSSNREIPQRLIVADQINGSAVDIVATGLEYFDSVTPEDGGQSLDFYGGVFEYVDIDLAVIGEVVKYINPDTGVAFVDLDDADGKDAGWYEKVATEPVSIAVPAGTPVYGRFSKITIPSGTDIGSVVITKG